MSIYYNFHPQTGELLSQGIADESPAEIAERLKIEAIRKETAIAAWAKAGQKGDPPADLYQEKPVFLVPSFATLIEPPPYGSGQIPVFDMESETWKVVADHRALRMFSKADGKMLDPLQLGEDLPENKDDKTFVQPPETGAEQAVRFNENTGLWDIIPDYRGRIAWNKNTRLAAPVDKVGPLDDDYTLDFPKQFDRWGPQGWETDPSLEAADQILELKENLNQIDVQSIRALRELILESDVADIGKLKQVLQANEDQAKDLRAKISDLQKVK